MLRPMKFDAVLHALPYLLRGAVTTVSVSFVGIALGLVIGTVVCVARVSGQGAAARVGALYVSFFRGVPLLVQLLLIYYLLPTVGLNVPALVAAIAGLSLASGAYQAEILRGALQAVPRGQTEAALAFGFAPGDTWRRILLPQCPARDAAAAGQRVHTAAEGVLADLGGRRRRADAGQHEHRLGSTSRPLEAYAAAGALYLAINLVSPASARWPSGASGGAEHAREFAATSRESAVAPAAASASLLMWLGGAPARCSASSSAFAWRYSGGCRCSTAALRRPMSRSSAARRSWCRFSCSIPAAPSSACGSTRPPPALSGFGSTAAPISPKSSAPGSPPCRGGSVEAAVCLGHGAARRSCAESCCRRCGRDPAGHASTCSIILSKETVVLSIITVPELMYQMQTMAAETFGAFVYAIFAMAIFYWVLVEAIAARRPRVERRTTAVLALATAA